MENNHGSKRSGRYIARVFQNTQPGFLNEVLGQFRPGRPVDQISEEPIVILRHHSANEFRVSSPQCTRDALRLGFATLEKAVTTATIHYIRGRAPELCVATHLEDQRLSNAPYQQLWDYSSPPGRKFLDEWRRQTMRSRIEPMKKIARSLRQHRN